ncbi:threonine--tRNA ligase [Candidatus Nanohalobium constans]|uniref:Threonine--tRNA ligase n=1 Tax=Candidatus Nanohalobium constans TaxID=2565781 RepID=A0A5Q0UEX4_9ARCH|nr:threonine--tRNA ligase [Candidatus Nanohalobium constans]QGA80142.1 threonyl-tRNA synthetase [Candidatus Nanohalobium constans]
MIEVELPDGSQLEVEENSTVEDVAYEIGTGLGDDTVAGKINGELVAKEDEVSEGDEIEIVTDQSEEYTQVLRHSAAHVFAQALKRIYGDQVKLTIGPWTDEGFYYDIDGVEIEQEDFEEIEEEMQNIIEEDLQIEREMLSREDAEEFFEDNEYKRQILDEEAGEGDTVSFYKQGEFKDLCKGPHVDSTGEVGGFKLLEIAGAYWRGDEENEMLTRIYGTAFSSESELGEFMEQRREAEKRDHRRIGREMDLFSIPEFAPGCAHFHPNGMKIRRELEEYIREKNAELGYTEVKTPELNKAELWKKTGHYEAFKEDGEMFAWEQDDTEYGLKPMNCANHSHIFDSNNKSYKELPIKLSEFGTVYRNEQSGELSGLMRVRGLTQDDGHAYLRKDQIEEEIKKHLDIIIEMYDEFGFEVNFIMETKPPKAQGPDELWDEAEEALGNAMDEKVGDYEVKPEEGAFYGPKIGVEVEDAIGRKWQLGTVQLDFVIPRNYGLKYTGEDNEEHYPVMLHRAILGSIDRFMGVMIEHFAGDFPTWLAPEQVRILPVTDRNQEYAEEIKEELSDFRVEIEERSWKVGKKIQNAHDDNVPYMLILGDDEEEAGNISVRDREEREEKEISVEEFKEALREEVEEKKLETDFLQ